MNEAAIVVLAAGNSSRLGTSKQLLPYKGKPLLLQVVEPALQVTPGSVVVVTGANADLVTAALHGSQVSVVHNPYWQQGMASGIIAGMNQVLEANNTLQNIIITVCDQPFISAALFQQLIATRAETSKGIVGCAYANTIGTPVLFSQKYYHFLLDLKGEDGAKKILRRYAADVATVAFEAGPIDIDTMEDYLQLITANEQG